MKIPYESCPTCAAAWTLFPPVKIEGSEAVRCIECKAVYPIRTTPAATKSADAGGVQSEYERGFEAGRKSWGTIIEQHKAYTAEIENILSHQPAPVERDPLDDLVARFSNALLKKLKLAQANGRSGWEKDDWEVDCQRGLLRHLEKGDPRDVAAYCAFMWHHGWITARPAPVSANASAEARPDDLRAQGWSVAVHNDYRLDGDPHTFWLLTKGGRAVKGEGHTDADALNEIRRAILTRPHASDCDKHGCMGDMAPGDPKDLAELLAKPSVLEPSDRTADVKRKPVGECPHGTHWRDCFICNPY